jgi:hypothetical protein
MPGRIRSSTCEICDEHSGNGTGFTTSTSVPPHLKLSFQQCSIFVLIYTLHLLERKVDKNLETSQKLCSFGCRRALKVLPRDLSWKVTPSKLLVREICTSYLNNSRGRRVYIPPIESLIHFTVWFIIIPSYFVSSNVSTLFLNYGTMVNLWPGLEYFCKNPRNIQNVSFSRQ